jgi:hypothetical protein
MFGIIALLVVVLVMTKQNQQLRKIEERIEHIEKGFGRASFSEENNTLLHSSTSSNELSTKDSLVRESMIGEKNTEKKEVPDSLQKRISEGESFLKNIPGSGNWLVKIGVILLIFAFGWLVSYAFVNDWIAPAGRILLGVLFGVALLAWGTHRFESVKVQGIALLFGGASITYISLFAGMVLYDFYGPALALVVMSLVVVYLAVLSVFRNAKSLAVSSIFFGLVAPLFVFSSLDVSLLFLYLLLLSAGTIWADALLKWRTATFIAISGVFLYSIVMNFLMAIDVSLLNFLFVLAFVALFYWASLMNMMSAKNVSVFDLLITLVLGLSFFVWMRMVVPEELYGISYVAGALVFILGSYAANVFSRLPQAVIMYGAVSFGLLLAATAEFFSGEVFAIALVAEIGAIVSAAYVLYGKQFPRYGNLLSILLLWPIVVSFESLELLLWASNRPLVSMSALPDFFVIIVFVAIFALLALAVSRFTNASENERTLSSLFALISMGYGMVVIWSYFHIVFSDYHIASMLSLIVFAVLGAGMYIIGKTNNHIRLYQFGSILLVLVLLRFFLVEFWNMDMIAKIGTAFVVGGILIGTAFLSGKKNV